MWRYVKRGFQQSFKRRACIDKQDKNVSNDKTCNTNQHKCCIAELFPCTNKSLSRFASKLGCSNDSKQEFHDKSNINHHSLFEAFGWSGALVFGWVISKQLWLKQRFTFDKDERCGGVFNHSRLFHLLAHIARTQPQTAFVLPQLPTTHTVDSKKSESSQLDCDEFEFAAEELKKVHEQILAEALNRRGIASISRSTGSEAITYFQKASQFNYPPASFNMGQCYELGIGTEQDFKQAAEWYKVASDQGHATAMYNLGVFYAHGWGGLQADIAMAKQLFVKASKLGQPDAKAALNKESKFNTDKLNKSSSNDFDLIEHFRPGDLNTTERKKFEYPLFSNTIQNSLNDEIRLKSFSSDKEWNLTFNSAVAF